MSSGSPRKEVSSRASTSQPPLAKPAEVNRFFEKTGILDALTRVFITMYEERDEWPADGPVHFLDLLTPGLSATEEIDTLNGRILQLQNRVAELAGRNENLRSILRKYEEIQLKKPSLKISDEIDGEDVDKRVTEVEEEIVEKSGPGEEETLVGEQDEEDK